MSREGLKLSLLENNNNNNNGAPTLTTPTLTPTTLRNIEQMLLDSGNAPVLACEPPELHENAAGFVPPAVEIPLSAQYEPSGPDKLQSSLDWVLHHEQQEGHDANPSVYHSPAQHPPPPPVPPVIASLIKDPSAAALPGPSNILLPLLSNLTPVTSMSSVSPLVPVLGPGSVLSNSNEPLNDSSSSSIINEPNNDSRSSTIHNCNDDDMNKRTSLSTNNQDNHSCLPPLMHSDVSPSGIINHNNNHVLAPGKKRVSGGMPSAQSRRSSLNSTTSSLTTTTNESSQQLTPDEKLKRDLRRERNKEAAARCRKRRLDQTLNLQDEVEELDSKKLSLQKELDSLRAQRDELEGLLMAHKAGHCSVLLSNEGPAIKKEPLEDKSSSSSSSSSSLCIKPEPSSSLACTVGGQ